MAATAGAKTLMDSTLPNAILAAKGPRVMGKTVDPTDAVASAEFALMGTSAGTGSAARLTWKERNAVQTAVVGM